MPFSDDPHDGPDVSVVIPTRNRRRLLALALGSALEQRAVRLEVVVVDEGSSDGTGAMVQGIGDPRVRLVRHDVPLGKSAARNRGITESVGRWVAFLDDDDVWSPDKLRLQLDELHRTARTWAYTGAVNITGEYRVIGGAPPLPPEEVARALPRINRVPGGCSGVIASRAGLPPDGFDGAFRLAEDWDLWIRLAQQGPPASVPRPLVGYRVHAGNSSFDTGLLLTEARMIERRYGGPIDWVSLYRHAARLCLRMNRRGAALGYYLRAAVCDRGQYLASGFLGDVRRVLPVRRMTVTQPEYPEWAAEARVWLDEFARRHAG